MADDKYDPRREQLVMEIRTLWDPALSNLSAADKSWLGQAVQADPQHASKLAYERSHTGFIREITVTVADVERIYRERATAG